MKFIAIDVETANADLASICQIGLVTFENGNIIERWNSLVNPDDEFDYINVSIHGIDEEKVEGQPYFNEIYIQLQKRLEGNIVVSHMPFDKIALYQATEKYSLKHISCTWLDSARVARRTWSQFAYSGYGLKNIANELGLVFKHHDAVEDAEVSGLILLRAIEASSLNLDEWLSRVEKPISSTTDEPIKFEGDPNGKMYGEVLVFTGTLNLPRISAAELAAKIGCKVEPSVTQRTTILIVGDQDVRRFNGQEKSSKHRKAEELIKKGQKIRILTEKDFVNLVGHA